MYDTGRLTDNGKRLLSAKYKDWYLDTPPIPVPCGKCPACLESRRREWVKRLQLESLCHSFSSFVTLTYDDKHLPSDGLASKRDIQLFLKRFRHAGRDYGFVMPPFKYFIVSEYGNLHHRPHYHGLLFGIDFYRPEWRPRLVSLDRYPRVTSDVLSAIWSNGFVLHDRLTMANIKYVSKYITKQSNDVWSLKSIALAKSLFATSNALTDFGRNCLLTGSVAVPSCNGFTKVRPPRFVDRYAELFANDLFESIKQSRREYVKNMPMFDPSRERERINLIIQRDNQKRKLDNET